MIKNSDRVRYTRAFLQSINALAYEELQGMRGTVTAQGKTYGRRLSLVYVRWDGDDRDRAVDRQVLQVMKNP